MGRGTRWGPEKAPAEESSELSPDDKEPACLDVEKMHLQEEETALHRP